MSKFIPSAVLVAAVIFNFAAAFGQSDHPAPNGSNIERSVSSHFAPEIAADEHTYRIICRNPKDREHAELCQQWRAAEAAVNQASANWLTLGLVFGTFVFTGIAAVATYRTWKVGEKNLKLSHTTLVLAQRARVSVDPGGIETNTFGKLVGQVVFINSGQMPAGQFKWRVKIIARNGGDWLADKVSSDDLEGEAVLPVGAKWNMGSGGCNPEPKFETDYVYVYGRVEYTDGFNVRRHTNFCHRYPWARKEEVGFNLPKGGSRIETRIPVMYARFHKNANEAN